jgi:hypothetical protein
MQAPFNILAYLLALGSSIWVTGRAARGLIVGLLAEGGPDIPEWVESGLPLRGRWLRAFLLAPLVLLTIASLFVFLLAAWALVLIGINEVLWGR